MKISLNWISKYTDISAILSDVGTKNLAHKYSIYTAEIDGIDYYLGDDRIVVGKVLEVKSHPDSDHLNVVQVDLGSMGKTQIVCGAANVVNAKYVPVATIGTTFKGDFVIKATKLRGQDSNGMICSADELGFQSERAPGIMILEEIFNENMLEANLGKPFYKLEIEIPGINGSNFKLKLSDIVFEIDNKFITNRPDLFSIVGNAREFGAIYGLDFNGYNKKFDFSVKGPTVEIKSDKVLSYHLLEIDNVKSKISPFDIEYMLFKSGISSKFDLVDMTNYIMTEVGQPMHAFDKSKINGNIVVRMAKTGEKILAINGETYELKDTDLVIADSEKILAIAGVMGGLDSAIDENTTDIYLESACFDPVSVRLTSQRLGLRSDSSTRYEKSLDPLLAEVALSRAIDFLDYLGKDYKIIGSSYYLNKDKVNNVKISLSKEFVEKKIGVIIEKSEFERILTSLGFGFDLNQDTYNIVVPSWRATKDISIKEDIAEEIGRINGYDKVAETPISGNLTIGSKNKTIELKDKIISYFAGVGFLEAYNYSFSNEELDEKIGITDNSNAIKIINAYSNEFTILRRSLLANLLQNVADNIKLDSNFALFEIGKTHQKIGEKFEEKLNLSGISYNKDFDYIKGVLEGFIKYLLPKSNIKTIQKNDLSYFHPNKSGYFILDSGEKIIDFGYINPIIASNFELDDSSILYFEVNFNLLLSKYLESSQSFSEISKFPGIDRELNFVLDEKKPVAEVIEIIKNSSSLVSDVKIIDIYRNIEKIGENKKSITFSVLLQDFTKTITDEEAMGVQNEIINNLAKEGIVIRS